MSRFVSRFNSTITREASGCVKSYICVRCLVYKVFTLYTQKVMMTGLTELQEDNRQLWG